MNKICEEDAQAREEALKRRRKGDLTLDADQSEDLEKVLLQEGKTETMAEQTCREWYQRMQRIEESKKR